MPTPAERKALLFFSVVLVLGASTRAFRAFHSRSPVDLDVASVKEIEGLRYIGPTLAKRIVADRDSLGPFGSMEGFSRVKGVGPSMVAKLDSTVTFSLLPRPTNRVISRPSELPKARRKPHRRDMRP